MNNLPKILVFIDWYYPGFRAGGPIRSCLNMINHLQENYYFYVVTSNRDYQSNSPYENITFNQWSDGLYNEKVIYLTEENKNQSYYLKLLKEQTFHAVMIFGLFSNNFSIIPLKAANKNKHNNIIVSPRGMLAPDALKLKSLKKKFFLKLAAFQKLYNEVCFHVTNEKEKNQVSNNISKFNSIVIADNFPRKLDSEYQKPIKKSGELNLLNIARIAPEKNLLFALDCLRGVNIGKINFDIYGSIYDEQYWEKCKKVINELPNNIKVNYRGVLDSEKVFETLSNYHFLFMPTLGENFGHIVFESFQSATPVLISNRTPWLDLKTKNIGFDLDLSHPNEFISTLNYMVEMGDTEFQKMSVSAMAYSKSKLNITEIKNQYLNLIK